MKQMWAPPARGDSFGRVFIEFIKWVEMDGLIGGDLSLEDGKVKDC